MALRREPHVLVVGGSDSSGGAGIARDIETISSIGVRTCLAVTALTVQTHEAVMEIHHSPSRLVAEQMRAALQANEVAAIKIGMLAAAEIVVAVAGVLRENPQVPAVLDPVLASTSGRALLEAGAITAMKRNLMPLCRLVTPNLIELALLVSSELAMDEGSALQQGQRLLAAGPQALLIKGGHASGPRSTDILLRSDQEPIHFDLPRLAVSMRGTGCVLASAIAAHLAKASPLEDSVRKGKRFVFEKLQRQTAE
ncbi:MULTISPECIES: hydroxymethylpyrimidine/phosphomethylpyrimidine kinase [unclassified Mesorhizobium]|uniref:hydroxymethylpyrimidine/phosphomethylpyrimidine kinase n=1 Tax=unclassified Mesorhizobium TaxID=325217 RepID=UPI001091B97E|nr:MULTISPECIES: hydroxymethylpyrimidine/phosphomethylpyrimidine kinase [unclassified Mesorhizobium]TGU40125.1 hydroxymethylpyrimidine/phosphomethylpyrimidine kinase [bacterium M00.F.Ca.ET.156.01.1.1]TGV15085.1 hydroxymethylpyrimidine/phosphomethylpyrimidine kinase [Mesorhizobium sp. M8A.F.Ca.ET.173.01.1.1]TGQ77224.1 hydroxymethylpyrimidine/phosphomethylpyrimidine kinase [Mesorhizobium sp. M8A.F.Ca.ET.207.01.1.1]TGQ89142.1 hydroxymethylpyrimidine/phosphomethylpyrimidine kinase [Mesorhizobium sp